MNKKTSQRLQTVLQLAKLKEQAAALKLAENIRNVESHRQQEQQLKQYKEDYSRQFHDQKKEPLSASDLSNFQRFYTSLGEAEMTQQERTVLANDQFSKAQEEWQIQYSKQKNMESLVERKNLEEIREDEKREQSKQDDRLFSSNGFSSIS